MGFLNNHQYTAVTSIINDCCDQNEPSSDDYYIETQLSSLLDAIRNQTDFSEPGPIEAARALRKKMKYGDLNDQYNALKILNLLIINGGKEMKSLCDDYKLLNRLEFYFKDPSTSNSTNVNSNLSSDIGPNKKIAELARSLMAEWYHEFPDDNRLKNINLLYERNMNGRKLKKRSNKSSNSNSRRQVPDFMNDEADMDYAPFGSDNDDDNNINNDPTDDDYSLYSASVNTHSRTNTRNTSGSNINRPKTNAELDKKFKIPKINYEKEAPKIMQLIAQANIMATNLLNTLKSLSSEELSIHSIKANDSFDECRAIRRKVLRYLQLVNREELLGPLLKCNDDLVVALKKYEEQSVPIEARVTNNGVNDDSDSDYDSMQDYESDNEPVNRPIQSSSKSGNGYIDSGDDSDNDDDDDYYYTKDEPPVPVPASPTSEILKKKAPPPVPAKRSVLQSPKMKKTIASSSSSSSARPSKNDYDPFSDDNEVAPVTWS